MLFFVSLMYEQEFLGLWKAEYGGIAIETAMSKSRIFAEITPNIAFTIGLCSRGASLVVLLVGRQGGFDVPEDAQEAVRSGREEYRR